MTITSGYSSGVASKQGKWAATHIRFKAISPHAANFFYETDNFSLHDSLRKLRSYGQDVQSQQGYSTSNRYALICGIWCWKKNFQSEGSAAVRETSLQSNKCEDCVQRNSFSLITKIVCRLRFLPTNEWIRLRDALSFFDSTSGLHTRKLNLGIDWCLEKLSSSSKKSVALRDSRRESRGCERCLF
jgi:hypothetical protein